MTVAMSQPPGASRTAELTGPECSPAWAPRVSARPAVSSPSPSSPSLGRKRPLAPCHSGPGGPSQHPAYASYHPRAIPAAGEAGKTWLRPRSRELQKGFQYGPRAQGKEPGLTLLATPLGSGKPKDVGLWRALEVRDTPKSRSRTSMPPRPTPHPFPVHQGCRARDRSGDVPGFPSRYPTPPTPNPATPGAGFSILRLARDGEFRIQAEGTPRVSSSSSGCPQDSLDRVGSASPHPGESTRAPSGGGVGQQKHAVRQKSY